MKDNVYAAQSLTKTCTSREVEACAAWGIDLEIAAGEVIVLLGPSGSRLNALRPRSAGDLCARSILSSFVT
jgi:predicted ABC-type transport system involved in lysophospholipase L1 biosynthesis ATPase subunit